MPDGQINILPLVEINGTQQVTKQRLNITLNNSFLNSTNLTFFNNTAIITLRGITFTNPQPVVDYDDDGGFDVCDATICTEFSFSNEVFVFNVSQFTSYAASEVGGQANLSILPSEIFFNDSHPRELDNITINATIRNNGTAAGNNFIVRFFDNTSGFTQIGSDFTVVSLAADSFVVVNQTYITILGNISIFVTVDPTDVVTESDETNNNATAQLHVQSYTIFFGDNLGNVTLATDTDTFYEWNVTDAGIVYFFDTDSQFNFSNLQALGFNTTNGTSFGDFADLDAILGMTNFNDSVVDLWASDNSTAVDVRNFTIFGRRIDKVPVLSSTVTGTFVTGILWDTEDDTNEEFDITEREDIIFITNINLSQSGASGSDIDYEIRVPSLIRLYQPSADTTAFITELR